MIGAREPAPAIRALVPAAPGWWLLARSEAGRTSRDPIGAWGLDAEGLLVAYVAGHGGNLDLATAMWPGCALEIRGPSALCGCDATTRQRSPKDAGWCLACECEIGDGADW